MKWGKPQREKQSRNQLIAHVCAKKATLGGPQLNVTNPFKKTLRPLRFGANVFP